MPADIASVTIDASTIVIDETGAAGTGTLTLHYSGSLAGDQFAPPVAANGGAGSDLVLEASGPTEPFTWATEASGNWTDPANWNNDGFYPGQFGNSDQVDIAVTTGITVTYDADLTIDSLTTSSNATLDITGGTLTDYLEHGQPRGRGRQCRDSRCRQWLGEFVLDSGLVEVTNGTLVLTGDDIDNAHGGGGYIDAIDGATIQLAADGTINEGTITIGAANDTADQLLIGAGDSEALVNLNVNNYGTVLIDSGATLTLEGRQFSAARSPTTAPMARWIPMAIARSITRRWTLRLWSPPGR